MIVKRNLGDIAELTAGVISQRVLADKKDGETGEGILFLSRKLYMTVSWMENGSIVLVHAFLLIFFLMICKKTKLT